MRYLKIVYGITKGLFLIATGAAIYLCYLLAFPYIVEHIDSLDISYAKKEGLSLLILIVAFVWFVIFTIRGTMSIFRYEIKAKNVTSSVLSNPPQQPLR